MREGYPTGPAFGSHYGRVGYIGRPTLGRRFERRPLGGVEGVKTSLGRYSEDKKMNGYLGGQKDQPPIGR